jgi:predicted nucleotidyltransferase
MKKIIQEKLQHIAAEHNIRILYACESGSRAWGFPSPDSDYDVRFIYCRNAKDYLSIAPQADHLSFPISNELDIYGWDLSKTLRLAYRSNTTPFEWLQSPIVYAEESLFRAELFDLCKHYFSRRSNTHHYLGIARGAMETISPDGNIKIKKLFYVLRPLLAAKWCVVKNSVAPMAIAPLMTLLPGELRERVKTLIQEKSTKAEGCTITPDPLLMDWIKNTEEECSILSGDFSKEYFKTNLLDNFFRKTIQEYDNTGT